MSLQSGNEVFAQIGDPGDEKGCRIIKVRILETSESKFSPTLRVPTYLVENLNKTTLARMRLIKEVHQLGDLKIDLFCTIGPLEIDDKLTEPGEYSFDYKGKWDRSTAKKALGF